MSTNTSHSSNFSNNSMPACSFVAATNYACVVSMPGYMQMQTELHNIATHDAAQDTSSQVPLQVAGGRIYIIYYQCQ
jgi:hypothetical protein